MKTNQKIDFTDNQISNIKRLLEALETIHLKQTYNSYYSDDGLKCCVIGAAFLMAEDVEKDNDYYISQSISLPTVNIQKAYGIPLALESKLIKWNDDLRLDFPEIAKKLKETLQTEYGLTIH